MQPSSFDTIVASGGTFGHAAWCSQQQGNNEFVTFDFGALLDGYCSDVTRTIALGKPDPKLKEIYDITLEAQLHTLAEHQARHD
ncbi:M24 family metallopeptidase, partial [Paenibacillus sp. DMB5]|uniref:M24 family metallopeptidase n=1 Tax=Paenibacillus sp. DMB5 TaxID=1780103 RepID=UPI0018E29DC9